MKRITVVFLVVVLSVMFAIPAVAHASSGSMPGAAAAKGLHNAAANGGMAGNSALFERFHGDAEMPGAAAAKGLHNAAANGGMAGNSALFERFHGS